MPNRLELRPANRLSQESSRFIAQAYRDGGQRGLPLKTLLLSEARLAQLVSIRADDFCLDEATLHIREGKGR